MEITHGNVDKLLIQLVNISFKAIRVPKGILFILENLMIKCENKDYLTSTQSNAISTPQITTR